MTVAKRFLFGLLGAACWVSAAPGGDINADGVVNVADRVMLDAMLAGRIPTGAAADIDGDGRVDAADREALTDLLLGHPPFERLGTLTIPVSGAVTVGDLGLSAPGAGSFVGMQIDVSRADREFGFDSAGNSAVYRLQGIPYHGSEALTVSLAGGGAERSGEPGMILVGEEVIAPSSMGYAVAARVLPAAWVDGRLVVELPACAGPPAELADQLPSTYRLYVQRLDGIVFDSYEVTYEESSGTKSRAGLMLDLISPEPLSAESKQRIADGMANAAYIISALGFDLTRRTSPVTIEIKKLAQGTCGLYQPSMVSLNRTSIDINVDLVTDPSRVNTLHRTLIHEYFHMVQAWYDPRSAFTQAKFNAPQTWIDEGTAVWIEQFAWGGTTSDYMANNAGEVMKGLHVDCEGLAWTNAAAHGRAQDHGYGMSLMFQYLFAEEICRPNPTLVNIYNGLAGGSDPRQAFMDAVPDPATWWDSMLVAYAQSEIGIPPVSFTRTRQNVVQPQVVFTSSKIMTDPEKRTLMRHDEFQSSALAVNWINQPVPADFHRRLVAELLTSDDQYALMAFQPRAGKNNSCVLRGTGKYLGTLADRHVTLLADRMTRSDNGVSMKPGHYLLTRRLVDSAADAAAPILNVWYVDTRVPINFSQGTKYRREYKVTGHIDCDRILHADPPESLGAFADFYVETEGTIHMPVQLNIEGSAYSSSYYTTTQYTIRVEHIRADGSGSTEVLGTLPFADMVSESFTITLHADDVALVLIVIAGEDLGLGAPGGVYALGTNMLVSMVFRYDYMLGITAPTP